MTNWVDYYSMDKKLVTIVGSYVPKVGDFVHLKLKTKLSARKVVGVRHIIDKTESIKEKFEVFLS